MENTISIKTLWAIAFANINNEGLSDNDFRHLMRVGIRMTEDIKTIIETHNTISQIEVNVKDHPEINAKGETYTIAIGGLIQKHPNFFNIEFKQKR